MSFDSLAAALSKRRGVTNPRGLAYVIGVRKYGKAEMQRRAMAARRRAGRH